MRFVLRDGTRELVVFSRDRFMRFPSRRAASDLLARYTTVPGNLARLRQSLRRSPQYAGLADVDGAILLQRLAQMLASGELRMLADAQLRVPWSWPYQLTPSLPSFDATADAGVGTPTEDTRALGEEEEIDDTPPDAIVPPVYPRIAKLEGDAMIAQTALFNAGIDRMRHSGMGASEQSAVAPELIEIARRQGGQLEAAAELVGMRLEALVRGGGALEKSSSVALALRGIAQSQGRGLIDSVEAMGGQLDALVGPTDLVSVSSSVARVVRNLAVHSGTPLVQGSETLWQMLLRLAGEAGEVVAERGSDVGDSFRDIAEDQGQSLGRGAESIADALRRLAD